MFCLTSADGWGKSKGRRAVGEDGKCNVREPGGNGGKVWESRGETKEL
jgi:hypothetical protein